ncbi:MAG: MBL fold metallo-hydrolase [Candidatus Aminicenantales bacterium]
MSMKSQRPLYGIILAACFVFGAALAQQPQGQPAQARPEPPPLTLTHIRGNIYEIGGGSGANCGLFWTEKEAFIIDAKMTDESAKKMLEEAKKLAPVPLTTVLLTHSDGDHVNGLTGFPAGLDIVAQENTRRHMAVAFQDPRQQAYLPNITFTETMTFFSGGKRLELFYFGPAHTDGDAVVYIPEDKVAFIGDLLFLGRDPLIHRQKNGSVLGAVKTLKALLALDADLYVPGHNEPVGKAELEKGLAYIQERLDKVKALIAEKKSLDEVKKAFNIEDTAAPSGRRWPSLVEVIYLELTEKKN